MKRQGANDRMIVRDIDSPSRDEEQEVDIWKQRYNHLVSILNIAELGIAKSCKNKDCFLVNFFNMSGDAGEYLNEGWKECDHCNQMFCNICKLVHKCSKKSKTK